MSDLTIVQRAHLDALLRNGTDAAEILRLRAEYLAANGAAMRDYYRGFNAFLDDLFTGMTRRRQCDCDDCGELAVETWAFDDAPIPSPLIPAPSSVIPGSSSYRPPIPTCVITRSPARRS